MFNNALVDLGIPGSYRNAIELSGDQRERTLKGDAAMIEDLHLIKQLSTKKTLEAGHQRAEPATAVSSRVVCFIVPRSSQSPAMCPRGRRWSKRKSRPIHATVCRS